ncbi:glycosyltransferase [Denitrobaculum tricleocarpae]|uniref:Glycosyltransferase family 4 protein n=1 Tax=Denitrobaculum tricleocarpae TaxID=2591009 RepID=A0A545TG91_9PROT|nr:glycosyltransferase [Denitrobaculum tricleocarpae]TQV76254.1 glycosyltransferase family 4 protein [Denitrobaculum tricleocarpae]
MKILMVSWFFPPANTIGAVRMGRMARFLSQQGHDLKVLAAADLPFPKTLPLEIAEEQVVYARWSDVNALPDRLTDAAKAVLRPFLSPGKAPEGGPVTEMANQASASRGASESPGALKRLRSTLGGFYSNAVNLPDARIGWMPHAVRKGRTLLSGWTPDVIYATAPPFTGLLIGYRLSKQFNVPLVTELRDRWVDDPYDPPPGWRLRIDGILERRVIARSSALVTVSEPWAEDYRAKYGKPVTVVYNGYDPEVLKDATSLGSPDKPALRIVYTGGIYPGKRDPAPLFAAMQSLGLGPDRIRIDFYGTNPDHVWPIAKRYDVEALVEVQPPVTHREAVELQQNADILLLMQWNDPREQGNVPGKLFEYMGARRPILLLGLENGVPAAFLREREAGFYGANPEVIAKQLEVWIDMKRKGGIPPLPESSRSGLARDDQYRKLNAFLGEIIPPRGE